MNKQREHLIDSLIEEGYLKTPGIIEAFKKIDRRDFTPEQYKSESYFDAPLPIGFGQTISQPLVVAFMLELLEPRPGEKILDVGCGSGWQTALLACIAGKARADADEAPIDLAEEQVSYEAGTESAIANKDKEEIEPSAVRVVAMERIPELKDFAEENLKKYNFLEKGIAQLVLGDGAKGYKKEEPYDKIIAGAAAAKEIPEAWKKQLKIGGRIVAPVGASVVVLEKTGKNKFSQKEFFGFSFVPLVVD